MSLPKRVTIELTNRCNRTCPECPRHKMTYPQGDMSLELLRLIIDQLPESTCIVPFFRGEPLLHPQFVEAMRTVERFETVQLATNGDYLNGANQDAILRACTFVSLSLHEYKLPSETSWIPLLDKCYNALIETQVSILETDLPKPKRQQFINSWEYYVNQVRIYKVHSTNGFGNMNLFPTQMPCNKPFEDMIIYWDGKVGLCNHDWNNPVYLGDLNIQPIKEVWHGSPIKWIRELHSYGNRRNMETCVHCDFEPKIMYGELIKNGRP